MSNDPPHILLYISTALTMLSTAGHWLIEQQFRNRVLQRQFGKELKRRGIKESGWATLLFVEPYADSQAAKELNAFITSHLPLVIWACRLELLAIYSVNLTALLFLLEIKDAIGQFIILGVSPILVFIGFYRSKRILLGFRRIKARCVSNPL